MRLLFVAFLFLTGCAIDVNGYRSSPSPGGKPHQVTFPEKFYPAR